MRETGISLTLLSDALGGTRKREGGRTARRDSSREREEKKFEKPSGRPAVGPRRHDREAMPPTRRGKERKKSELVWKWGLHNFFYFSLFPLEEEKKRKRSSRPPRSALISLCLRSGRESGGEFFLFTYTSSIEEKGGRKGSSASFHHGNLLFSIIITSKGGNFKAPCSPLLCFTGRLYHLPRSRAATGWKERRKERKKSSPERTKRVLLPLPFMQEKGSFS